MLIKHVHGNHVGVLEGEEEKKCVANLCSAVH
jgi:hypothetical protein